MGTSGSSLGPGSDTPLVPTWLDEPNDYPLPAGDDIPDGTDNNPDQENPLPQPDIEPAPIPQRFRDARRNFTMFASSGGGNSGALGRAIGGYVRSGAGGASGAVRRMGASRATAGGVLSVLRGIQRDGVAATIRRLNLNDLVGRSSTEILVGLTDTICPDGGSIDEGIARDAWLETLTELDQLGITDLGEMNSDQIQQFFLTFVTHAIETLLFQSIGTKGLSIAVDLVAIEAFELQLRDYIRRAVRDAFTRDLTMLEQMSDQDIKDIVDETYHNTWELLEMWGENQE